MARSPPSFLQNRPHSTRKQEAGAANPYLGKEGDIGSPGLQYTEWKGGGGTQMGSAKWERPDPGAGKVQSRERQATPLPQPRKVSGTGCLSYCRKQGTKTGLG